jgi:hypothetical protein
LRWCATGTSAAAIDGERLGGHPLQGEEGAGTAWVASVECLAHWRGGEEARGGRGGGTAPRQCDRRGHGRERRAGGG